VDKGVRKAGLALIVLLFATPTVYAKTCSADGYRKSCKECNFVNGKMDKACLEKGKRDSSMCVATGHFNIVAGALWEFLSLITSKEKNKWDKLGEKLVDGCPAAKRCVDGLKYCTGNLVSCRGTDQEDCSDPTCFNCYVMADACIARADKDCEGKAECGDGNCDIKDGESSKTCCTDCKCWIGEKCVNNKCEIVATTTTTMRPTTTTMSRRQAQNNLADFFCEESLILPLAFLLAGLAKLLSL
jgi:hypothetical protein